MNARQLALPLGHEPGYAADDYIADASNAVARAWLAEPGLWPGGRLALHGAMGSGKTHLLHAWSAQSGAQLIAGPALRQPLLAGTGLAIDDADCCDPHALLHTLNAAAEARRCVLLAAREPPGRWPVGLPDLRSRLRATIATELHDPSDRLRATLLARLLSDRQLTVAPVHQAWLLARLPRRAAVLREAAARLDRASLASGGAVTRTLLQRIAAALDDEHPEPSQPD